MKEEIEERRKTKIHFNLQFSNSLFQANSGPASCPSMHTPEYYCILLLNKSKRNVQIGGYHVIWMKKSGQENVLQSMR